MIQFRRITYEDTKPFLLKKHYAYRMPSISFAFGLYEDDELHGVLTFGEPASHSLVIGIAGVKNAKKVIELNRLYIDDIISQNIKNITSEFVSYGLRQLKPLNKIVVSYADSGMNHTGFIYQATNFLYTGKTRQRTDKFAGIDKHSRHYDKNAKEKYRVIRSSKYRYVYFACDRRHKKEYMKDLNYPIYKNYPKHDDKHYKVGDIKPFIVLNKETNKKEILKKENA